MPELQYYTKEQIKAERYRLNLTQEQLADLSYLSVQTIRSVEAGRSATPSNLLLLTYVLQDYEDYYMEDE